MTGDPALTHEPFRRGILFWGFFLATLALGMLVVLTLHFRASPDDPTPVDSGPLYPRIERILPELFRDQQADVDASLDIVYKDIESAVDRAFESVFERIPTFLDFHYSVIGEYVELAAAASPLVASRVKTILVEDSGFEEHLDSAMVEIGATGDSQMEWLLERLRGRLQEKLELEPDQLVAITAMAKLTHEDTLERFGTTELALKGAGAAVGVGAVGAALAASIGPKIAAKVAAKAAGKAAAKAAGAGGSTAAGAALGLLCGPAALVCAPAGAVIGAAIGWVTVDKVVVEADEWLHRAEFEREIVALLDAEKAQMKEKIRMFYQQRVADVIDTLKRNLKDVKVKDLP